MSEPASGSLHPAGTTPAPAPRRPSFAPVVRPVSAEDLAALDLLMRESLRLLAEEAAAFGRYLQGLVTLEALNELTHACTRARSAYDRKRDAVLVRTGRI